MNRLQEHLVRRQQVVFSSPAVAVWTEELAAAGDHPWRHRIDRVTRRGPLRSWGATVARPVGDAVVIVQILRNC